MTPDSTRTDAPAAAPLFGLITGLALGPVLTAPRAAAIALILIAILSLSLSLRRLKSRFRPPVAVTLFLAAGLLLAVRIAERERLEQAAFAELPRERFVIVEAPIDRDWTERPSAFLLRTTGFRANGAVFSAPLNIYARFPPAEIGMESHVRAEGFLRPNDYGGYILSVKSPELLAYRGHISLWHPRGWNRALANRLELYANSHPDEVALAQSLLLGRGERLSPELRENFRRGGTYHLLVFSGLQIALAAGLLAALFRLWHAPRAADWLLLSFSVAAPLFIGPTASVSRASIGIGLYALARIFKRPTSIENLWCVAAMLRLAFDPRDLTDPSFHLTYAGAGALIFIGKYLPRPVGHLLGAEVAIAPLSLYHFHQFALGGSVVTLVMSPVIFAMLVVSLLACIHPWFLEAVGVLHRVCQFLNAGGLAGSFAAPPPASMIAGAGGALLALVLLRKRRRALAILAALLIPSGAAIVRSVTQRSVDAPQVTFFEIGQGDAIALRSGSRTILVDGGPGNQIVPLLADRGVRRLEAVILSHAHPDHCEGLLGVLAHLDVGSLWISPRRFRGDCATRLLEAARSTRTPIHLVRDGDIVVMDDIRLIVHTVTANLRRAPENNASVVLLAEAGGRRVLLTGDLEKEAELYLEDRNLRADVLKVAHHGSSSSTSPRWLAMVDPRIAVISCGRRNLFGHPHPEVLDALDARMIRTWRTDHHGTVDLQVREGRLFVRTGSGDS